MQGGLTSAGRKSCLPMKIDVIVSMNVVEHVNDLNAYFSYVADRLPVGGVFAFTGLTSKIIANEARHKKYKNFMPLEHINFFTPKSLDMMVKKYSFARIPAGKMVQSIENFPQLLFPLAKRYYRGFYPTGGLKIHLVKIAE